MTTYRRVNMFIIINNFSAHIPFKSHTQSYPINLGAVSAHTTEYSVFKT